METLIHPLFGQIHVRTHPRAVRYTFRYVCDGPVVSGLIVTAPEGYSQADLMRAIKQNQTQLQTMISRAQLSSSTRTTSARIDWNFHIRTDCLCIELVKGTSSSFYLHNENAQLREIESGNVEVIKPALLQIICPPDCDFDADGRQGWLEKVIVEGIRRHAKAQLIPRMNRLAQHYHISLHEVKINNSKGHWGSCGRHKTKDSLNTIYFNINLSLFTLLLPLPVQRLILLHELCHTCHMDHSPAFHHQLDQWLDGMEHTLEAQLKAFSTTIYSFGKSNT